MIICSEIKKKYVFSAIVFLIGLRPSLIAQKEYRLSSMDAAIVSFHILDNQYCSSITQFDIFDSISYTYNIFPCKIDSVLMVHAVGGYIDTRWFKKVHFILIDNTTQLYADSSYMGSVGVEFDMEYVVLNVIIEKDVLVLNMRDGHPRPAGFLCDCEITDKETISICEDYKNRIIEKINHCKNNGIKDCRTIDK